MGPLTAKVHAHATACLAPVTGAGTLPDPEECLRVLSKVRTGGFSVSSSGLILHWRLRNARVKYVSLRLNDLAGRVRPGETSNFIMARELVRALFGEAGRQWNWDIQTLADLLPMCDAAGVTLFEDSFDALSRHLASNDVFAKRRGIDLEDSQCQLRAALAKYLDNGGDAESLKAIVDEAIVDRVMGS